MFRRWGCTVGIGAEGHESNQSWHLAAAGRPDLLGLACGGVVVAMAVWLNSDPDLAAGPIGAKCCGETTGSELG